MSADKPFENFARAVKERWPDEPDPVEDNLERADNANSPEHALFFAQVATVHQLRKLTEEQHVGNLIAFTVALSTPTDWDALVDEDRRLFMASYRFIVEKLGLKS